MGEMTIAALERLVESAPITESKDPHAEAATLIKSHDKLMNMLNRELGSVQSAFKSAADQQKRLEKSGVGVTEAHTLLGGRALSSLRNLQKLVNGAVEHVEHTVAAAKKGHGSWGRNESVEDPWAPLEEGFQVTTPTEPSSNPIPGFQSSSMKDAARGAAMFDRIAKSSGTQVAIGNRTFTSLEPAMDVGSGPSKGGHVVVLGGAKGSQYLMLVPPASGVGNGGTVSVMSLGSATSQSYSVEPTAIESVEQDSDMGLREASHDVSEAAEWGMSDTEALNSAIAVAVHSGTLCHHLEDTDYDSDTISAMRTSLAAGTPLTVEKRTLTMHEMLSVVQVFDALNEENAKKLGDMDVDSMINTVQTMRMRSA